MVSLLIILARLLLFTEPTFAQVLPQGAQVEKVAGEFGFLEGPVWKDGLLIFSDIPGNRLVQLKGGKVSTFREPSENANGNTLDRQGRLLTCHHGSRQVTRTLADGTVVVLADKFEGKRLNSPNDLTVRRNGDIYFTDPPYGIQKSQEELGFYGVFRIDVKGQLQAVARDFVKPNGIALSPDERTLYVADTERSHIRRFEVRADGSLLDQGTFAQCPGPDGMRVDRKGNLYVSSGPAVRVFSPLGKELGVIPVPESVANCAFGGADGKTLYITASTSLYRIATLIGG